MPSSNVYRVSEKDPLAHVDRVGIIIASSAQEAIDLFVSKVNDGIALKRGAEVKVCVYTERQHKSRVLSWHIVGYGDTDD